MSQPLHQQCNDLPSATSNMPMATRVADRRAGTPLPASRLGPVLASSHVVAIAIAIATSAVAHAQDEVKFRVVRDLEWIELLDRDHGWNAADGCISIPLNGIETPGLDPHPRTFFTFGDSIIGDVGPDGKRLPGNVFVNNSLLAIDGLQPNPARSRFIYVRDGGDGKPASAFIPSVPDAQPGDYYWLTDGIVVGEALYIFANHLRPRPGGGFPRNQGVAMIALPVTSRPPFEDQIQRKVPLYHPGEGEIGPYQFPSCFVSNTELAGAVNPDGYIYAYGAREDPFVKKAIVARVRPETFADISSWRYWNGADWVEGITNSEPMTGRISGIYSVAPMADGRAIMVFQQDTIGENVAIRIGESLVGPWGPMIEIYRCPEVDISPNVYCYNASAHPHLSKPNELLISYCVNSTDFNEAFTYADLARPRFIRLILEEQ